MGGLGIPCRMICNVLTISAMHMYVLSNVCTFMNMEIKCHMTCDADDDYVTYDNHDNN
jgi:hypothetical protein